MSVYKRGEVWWFEFFFKGERIRRSTRQGDRKAARQMEAAYRTALAKGEAGLFERTPAPALRDFAQKFIDAIQVRNANKPNTVMFYARKLAALLRYEPLATARLDQIDEALIESFVQHRSRDVSPASVNRELATLRRLLRMAHEWKVTGYVPRIRLLPGERNREFVLSYQQERLYLEAAPQPLRDLTMLLLDTGLRVGEAVGLEWTDVHLNPVNGAKFGYVRVREGKSKNARRNVCLTPRVRAMLASRKVDAKTRWLFPDGEARPIPVDHLDRHHARIRNLLRLPKEFVLHSLRHTMLSRLGESGVDAFTIMRIAGHSTIVVSQRYVHPSPEAIERAFEKLGALNDAGSIPEGQKMLALPTVLPTEDKNASRAIKQLL